MAEDHKPDVDREQCQHQAIGWLLHAAESRIPGVLAATATAAQQVANESGSPTDQGVSDCLRAWSERHTPIDLTYRWRNATAAIRGYLVEKNVPWDELDQWADSLSALVREELVGP